jgi:hypothetical protein
MELTHLDCSNRRKTPLETCLIVGRLLAVAVLPSSVSTYLLVAGEQAFYQVTRRVYDVR